ncbi:MAG: zinc finger domain-containing protein, partial [Myxococcota bacterium]
GWVEAVTGAPVTDVAAVGKHLLVGIGEGGGAAGRLVAHVHLGMRGRVHGYAPDREARPPGAEPTLRLELAERAWMFRRAARAELLRAVDLAQHPSLSRLGPDLLDREVDLDQVVRRARSREPRTVSDCLLDQRVACGMGNVYKCEVLFLAGIDPRTLLSRVPDAALRWLYGQARRLLQQNLGGWSRTTVRAVEAATPPRRGEPRLWVYGRSGLPCLRCQATVRVSRLGDAARATYWCPRCQPRTATEDWRPPAGFALLP